MTVECMLCAEQAEFIGVAQCNHEPICYRCIYKMRVISKNNFCPICKFESKQIIIMSNFQTFSSIKGQVLPDKNYADIFYTQAQGKKQFEKLTEFKCFVKVNGKSCKVDKKFPSIAFLQKHLKEQHHRFLCEICVQKKTCVLQQQKLYSFKALSKHKQRGDMDQFGNIVFLHPYCGFCKTYFFNDDEFRIHINLEHMLCNVCGKQQRYRYYKNYDNLEIHYKISHYICSDQQCLNKKFIAFKNAEELKVHKMQIHDKSNNKKIDIKQLCGFQYQGHNPDDQYMPIKDKEGIDMEDQFLGLKKSKNKALGQADQQNDGLLDIRYFYPCALEEDQHFEQAFRLKHNKQQDQKKQDQQKQKASQKKKKYVSKTQFEKQKPLIAKQNEHFFVEDLLLIQSLHLTKIKFQDFQTKLKIFLKEEDFQKFTALHKKLLKRKATEEQFLEEYFHILKRVSLKSAYNIFPHYIRALTSEELRQNLDKQFLRCLKKLPFKKPNLLQKSQKYSQFFAMLLKQIQKNIQYRIKNKILSIKKTVKKDKQRLYQIMGVVRRLKIQQMAKLKFATNFGLQKDTIDYIHNNIFKKNFDQTQNRLDKIQNQEFLDLFIFVKYSLQAIKHAQNMHLQKNKIHQNILQDFLYDRPQLQKQYGLKKQQLKTIDEKIQFEKLQEQKKIKNQLKQIEKKSQLYGVNVKTDFNLGDKSDFPELVIEKKSQQQKKQQHNLKEIVQQAKQKPATYQKKINEMFPTLEEQTKTLTLQNKKSSQTSNESQKKQEKKQKAWWEKINQKKVDQQELEVIRVKKGGKNKKQKWVSVKVDTFFGK